MCNQAFEKFRFTPNVMLLWLKLELNLRFSMEKSPACSLEITQKEASLGNPVDETLLKLERISGDDSERSSSSSTMSDSDCCGNVHKKVSLWFSFLNFVLVVWE